MHTMTLREINNLKKKASDSIKEKEKQNFLKNILPHLKLIKNTLFYLECQYSNRGKCLCIWDGKVYCLRDDKAIPYKEFTIEYIHKSEKDGYFECIKKYNDGKEYYFLNKNFYINEKLIHEWIQKNYLTLKVMVANIHSKKENDLSDFSILGTLAADFSNKFPNKNIEDLINYYKIYDEFDWSKPLIGGMDLGGNLKGDFSTLVITDPETFSVIAVLRTNSQSTTY